MTTDRELFKEAGRCDERAGWVPGCARTTKEGVLRLGVEDVLGEDSAA